MVAPSARGNPRFKAGGSQWKSSWRRKQPYTEMCCIGGFSNDPGAQFYQDAGGALDIVPASGWFLGGIAKITTIPVAEQVIARNGGLASEGWLLTVLPGVNANTLAFRFTVWDTAGARVLTSNDLTFDEAYNTDELATDGLLFRLAAIFNPPGSTLGSTFGSIGFRVEGGNVVGLAPLLAAYTNTSPILIIGEGTGMSLEAPNCIHGIVGGDSLVGDATDDQEQAQEDWLASIGPLQFAGNLIGTGGSYQLEPFPDPSGLGRFVNTNGWRANSPVVGPGAPDPWLPFVGSTNLVYGAAAPEVLSVACSQPSVFWGEVYAG